MLYFCRNILKFIREADDYPMTTPIICKRGLWKKIMDFLWNGDPLNPFDVYQNQILTNTTDGVGDDILGENDAEPNDDAPEASSSGLTTITCL